MSNFSGKGLNIFWIQILILQQVIVKNNQSVVNFSTSL